MAASLQADPELRVERVPGGLGELSVAVDGKRVYHNLRLLKPRPEKVVEAVRRHL